MQINVKITTMQSKLYINSFQISHNDGDYTSTVILHLNNNQSWISTELV